MIIEKCVPPDIPVLREIWKESFGDSDRFLDCFFDSHPVEDSLCVRMDGRPVAVLYRFDCFYREKKLAYIYAVATDKAYRGRGLCRSLMGACHEALKASGYSGAVLVPGHEKLFSMYASMGYKSFCPMTVTTASAGVPMPMERTDASEYFRFRNLYMPEAMITQDSASAFLRCFTEFYRGEGLAVCVTRDVDTLLFQEFLGDPEKIGGVIAGLGAKEGIFRYPDPKGRDKAMYFSLDGTDLKDAYFGIFMD